MTSGRHQCHYRPAIGKINQISANVAIVHAIVDQLAIEAKTFHMGNASYRDRQSGQKRQDQKTSSLKAEYTKWPRLDLRPGRQPVRPSYAPGPIEIGETGPRTPGKMGKEDPANSVASIRR